MKNNESNSKKQIDINSNEKQDMGKTKPFKKIKKKHRIIIGVLILFIVIIAIEGFETYWRKTHDEYLNYYYIKTYFLTKKQTQRLIDGEIDEFVEALDYSDKKIKVKGKDEPQNVNKYIKKEMQYFYKDFLKGKDVKIKNIDITPHNLKSIFCWPGSSVELEVEGIGKINLIYGLDESEDSNKCKINFYTETPVDKNYEITVNQKINPLVDESYCYCSIHSVNNLQELDKLNELDYLDKRLSHFIYRYEFNGKHQKELIKRIKDMKKESEILSINISEKEYDQKNRKTTRVLKLKVKDKKTNKVAVLKQTLIDSYDYCLPEKDAKLIANDGISPELEKKLLELF